jgi:hypothetical protein
VCRRQGVALGAVSQRNRRHRAVAATLTLFCLGTATFGNGHGGDPRTAGGPRESLKLPALPQGGGAADLEAIGNGSRNRPELGLGGPQTSAAWYGICSRDVKERRELGRRDGLGKEAYRPSEHVEQGHSKSAAEMQRYRESSCWQGLRSAVTPETPGCHWSQIDHGSQYDARSGATAGSNR